MGNDLGQEILNMKKACDTEPYQRSDCPTDGWTLEELDDGRLHCPFCGLVIG